MQREKVLKDLESCEGAVNVTGATAPSIVEVLDCSSIFEHHVSIGGILHMLESGEIRVNLHIFNIVTKQFDVETMSLIDLDSKSFIRLLIGKGFTRKEAKVLCATMGKNVRAMIDSKDAKIVQSAHEWLGWFSINTGVAFKANAIYTPSGASKSVYAGRYSIVSRGNIQAVRQVFSDFIKENTALKAVCGMAASATSLPFANIMWGAGIDNVLNHLVGTSSTGKSTAAALFVSFGSAPFGDGSLTLTFLSTDNALLNQVAGINGYPVAIEELSTSSRKQLSELVYALSNGSGKVRCIAGGMGVSGDSRFSTVFLSNGETSLIKKCFKTEGIAARVLEFCNVVYTRSADDATAIKTFAKENFGILTPLVAQELLRDSEKWHKRFIEWQKRIRQRIADEQLILGIADRITDILALYMVSCEILNAVLSLSFGLEDVFEFYFVHMITKNAEDSNLGTRAHASILRHFARYKDRYIDADMVRLMHPQGEDNYSIVPQYEGILMSASRTRKDKVGNLYNRYIVFYPDVLEKILEDNGYPDARVALKAMHKDGVLKTKDASRDYMETYLNDIKTKVFAVFYSDIHYGSPKDIEVAED